MALFDFEKHQANNILKGFIDDDIEKARAVPVGTIMTRKSGLVERKTATGWETVKRTHPDHPSNKQTESSSHKKESTESAPKSSSEQSDDEYLKKIKELEKELEEVSGKTDFFSSSGRQLRSREEAIKNRERVRELKGQIDLIKEPGVALDDSKNTLDKILSNNGQGVKQQHFDKTDKVVLQSLKKRIEDWDEERSKKFQQERGFGLYSDRNGGGPADTYHALSSIDKALKKYDKENEPTKQG